MTRFFSIKGMDEYDLSPLTAKLVERKSMLAKLLANENIRVQQEQRDEPRFEFATRTLYLPMWNTVSETVYNLLVGHETGHAVDTPEREWNESIESLAKKYSITPVPSKKMKDIAHGYINTIEDIRIEKKRIKKFPGLKKDFIEGYKELEKRGFFNDALREKNLYFIDKINLKYKLNKLYPYTKIELALIDEIEKMDTYQDAVTVADKILAYESSKLDQTDPPEMGLKIFIVCNDPSEGDSDQKQKGEGNGNGLSKEPHEESSDESKGSKGRDSQSDSRDGSKGDDNEGKQKSPGSNKSGDRKSSQGKETTGNGGGDNDRKDEPEGGGKRSGSDRVDSGQDTESSRQHDSANGEDGKKGSQPRGTDQSSGEGTNDSQQSPGKSSDLLKQESGVNGTGVDKSLIYTPILDISIHLDAPIVYNLFEKAKHKLVDKEATSNRYITIGKQNIKNVIKKGNKDALAGVSTTKFLDFKKAERKTTAFLVSEFEMKKAAIDFKRQKISKTGVLNTNKLFAYKYSDDIFKKNIIVEKGKNHGFILIIDGSSSMSSYMDQTLKQMLSVVLFCRQIGVPFEVYIFKSGGNSGFSENKGEIEFSGFHLELLLHSKMSKLEFVNAASYVCTRVYAGGSTPLLQSIAAAPYLVASFQSKYHVDIMNVIFLTDGESDAAAIYISPTNDNVHNIYFRDNYLNKDIYVNKFATPFYSGRVSLGYNSGIQEVLLGRLKEWTQCNLIGFFLAEERKLRYYPDVNKEDWNNYGFTSTKKAGYDEYFLIDPTKLDLATNIGSLDGMKSIKNTRKLLSTFIERIAK
jgi:hypothetical protein